MPTSEAANSDRSANAPQAKGQGRLSILYVGAGIVLLLALGALLWPRNGADSGQSVVVVFDHNDGEYRKARVYEPLVRWLETYSDTPLKLVLLGNRQVFQAEVALRPDLIFCPDGVALELDPAAYVPLVIARRRVPQNLRPRSVLVRRKSAPQTTQPWLDFPQRTIFGDSLSLVATTVLRREPGTKELADALGRCAWGPDPYDHAPALHAARLGGFDYLVVRQWDAQRFIQSGLISSLDWSVLALSAPVPDVVVMVRADLPAGVRMRMVEAMTGLGRSQGQDDALTRDLVRGLQQIGLSGFNLMLEPDFDKLRRSHAGNWPWSPD